MTMNTSLIKPRRLAAVALSLAVIPFAANTASAAAKTRSDQGKPTTTAVAAPAATTSSTATSSAPVTSVIAIGGYVFYNMTYLEAVDAYFAAVAAAPAGYTPPPVTSVSVSTTVSGTVEG